MTMGALHEGHARLISGAREWLMTRYDLDEPDEAQVVVTIFVNPTQFGPGEDFHQYPRTFESDLEVCREHGADVVFAPTPDQLYPHGTGGITIDPGPLGDELEGAVRPGHFRGVLTVVHKLLMLTEPEAALFGEKDYQQLTLIRRMVRDLNIPVDIVGVPTVREDGTGLALSSRNRYLSDEQRHQARILPIVLATGEEALETSVSPPADVVDLLRQALLASPGVESVDYLELRGPDLGPPPESGEARLLVAARIGGVRLIDNVMMRIGDRA
jgi:pantoate--beta-alanine ligase